MYVAYMDLEKAYDRIDRDAMWRVLSMYGIKTGRPRKSWMNGVNETLKRKGLNIQEAKDSVQDRNGWRSICRGVV